VCWKGSCVPTSDVFFFFSINLFFNEIVCFFFLFLWVFTIARQAGRPGHGDGVWTDGGGADWRIAIGSEGWKLAWPGLS
jgi:hypothetical protein